MTKYPFFPFNWTRIVDEAPKHVSGTMCILSNDLIFAEEHDDVIKWKHFPRYWPFVGGDSPATGEFLAQRPVTRSFNVFFDLRLNKHLSKQSWEWWFETASSSLWLQCNETHSGSLMLLYCLLSCMCYFPYDEVFLKYTYRPHVCITITICKISRQYVALFSSLLLQFRLYRLRYNVMIYINMIFVIRMAAPQSSKRWPFRCALFRDWILS